MYIVTRLLATRQRRVHLNGPLAVACIALIFASIWIYPNLGPISGSNGGSEGPAAVKANKSAVRLKTKTRGVLGLNNDLGSKFLLVQCHRGQFSNRLSCLKRGILLSRALQRVLVMPIFTDVVPTVDVSKYVSLECLRRNSLVVTFHEFQERICHGAGLKTPQPVALGVAQSYPGNMSTTDIRRGAFCEDSALLQLETGYSLQDYRGFKCWDRREDVTNVRDLGIQVSGCTHVDPSSLSGSYSLADIRRHFADRPEEVMLFLDLFGVDLMPSPNDVADTLSDPGQFCSWLPTEVAAAAADTVMQILIPPPLQLLTMSGGGGEGGGVLGLTAVVDPTTHRTLFMDPSGLAHEPPPVRLRGARQYAAVHLRRSDWFYFCGGSEQCFYSIAEAAAWLSETLAARGLDTLYVSTNADAREKLMLRRAVAGRLLYWEDALVQLRAWQAEGLAAAAAAAATATSPPLQGSGEVVINAAQGGAAPPAWLMRLPLDDALMVQMVEKAICMQAAFFISSVGSTFSEQIHDFRNGGLRDTEWGIIERKFPSAVATGTAESATMPNSGSSSSSSGEVLTVVPLREPSTYLCDTRTPRYADERRLPDFYNPRVFLEEVGPIVTPVLDAALGLWRRLTKGEAAPAAPAAVTAAVAESPPRPRPTLWQVLTAPARALEWLSIVVKDGHAMAAANRFVDMYTGGAMVGLVVESTLAASPAALADCVVAAAAAAGAVSLHVTLTGVPEHQQVLLMQELEARTALRQVTRMGGADQERESTFTLMWRGDGLGRHAEPALLEELPTFLERVDAYVLAKSRILMGDPRGALFRQVEDTRRVFGFTDPRDGLCAQA